MEIIQHINDSCRLAELVSDEILIRETSDALDLMANLSYEGFDRIMLHEKNLHPDFFDLRTGLAGEILQKFSNYRMKFAIIGHFNYPGKSLRDFIRESNKGSQVFFLPDKESALKKMFTAK